MERRKTEDRRQVHMFVSDDRRDGPYERRDDETRRRERERERQKIESIRSFKEKDNVPLPATPMITQKAIGLYRPGAAGCCCGRNVAPVIALWKYRGWKPLQRRNGSLKVQPLAAMITKKSCAIKRSPGSLKGHRGFWIFM